MRLVPALIWILLISDAAALQHKDASASQAINPGRVVEIVNQAARSDLRRLWQELGVSSGEFDCERNCIARLIALPDTPSAQGSYTIVRIQTNDFDPPYRFLVFSRVLRTRRWTFRGTVDFGFDDTDTCYAPKPSLERTGGLRWLAFTYPRTCRGTGVSNTEQQWYDLRGDRIAKAFQISSEGHDFAGYVFDPGWKWRSRILRYVRDAQQETVYARLEFTFYATLDAPTTFSTQTAIAALTKTPTGQYAFDAARSDATAGLLWNLPWQLPYDRATTFLQINLDRLRVLASTHSGTDRHWLERLLDRSKPSAYKSELMRLLSNR